MLILNQPCLDRPIRKKVKKLPRPKWLVNGFPATIHTWTPYQYDRLIVKPKDAQLCENGMWVALRMD